MTGVARVAAPRCIREFSRTDTCCIDKNSSAELSESINSMYRWYQRAERCYAYLADVPSDEDPRIENSCFMRSRWFTRGWTLQELIAPLDLVIFARDWRVIGTKLSLQGTIAAITGIDKAVLVDGNLRRMSIARKMSWASKRETTRVEDIAYCLMGLFNINMPMLYGEGEKAFIRLQEEIIKDSDDHSIFAWKDSMALSESSSGLLARSPAVFVDSCRIDPVLLSLCYSPPYFKTNKGLYIQLELLPMDKTKKIYFAVLHCAIDAIGDPVGIYLKRIDVSRDQYVRVRTGMLKTVATETDREGGQQTIYVAQV